MGYIEKYLIDGETVIYRANISPAILIIQGVLCSALMWIGSKISNFILIAFGILSIYLILRTILVLLSSEFTLTDKRIIAKKGILKQHSVEILLSKVESISITQPLLGRVFDYGTIVVKGSGGTHELFSSIGNPNELRRKVNDQISKLISQRK